MVAYMISSRPVWGAWIEIAVPDEVPAAHAGRAPYGARGLKFDKCGFCMLEWGSRPVWGAWIEIIS